MKKWYKTKIAKIILVATAFVSSILLVVSVVSGAMCLSTLGREWNDRSVEYEDSEDLNQQMMIDAVNVMSLLRGKQYFEVDGKYDGNRVVDVKAFCDRSISTLESSSGLEYRMKDLLAIGREIKEGSIGEWEYSDAENPIIVCKKPDGTYEYYYFTQFKEMIDQGELQNLMQSEEMEEVLDVLKEGNRYENESAARPILDKENTVRYVDCWNYDGYQMEEKYHPVGAESILDVMNKNEQWNGKLEEMFCDIRDAAIELSDYKETYDGKEMFLREGTTNLTYLYINREAQTIETNKKAYADYDSFELSKAMKKESGKYVILSSDSSLNETNLSKANMNEWMDHLDERVLGKDFIFALILDTDYAIQDEYFASKESYEAMSKMMIPSAVCLVLSVISFLVSIIWLTVIEEGQNRFDKIKTEIAAAGVFAIWIAGILCMGEFMDSYGYAVGVVETVIFAGGIGVWSGVCFLVGYLSLVRRIKAKTLWKNSILRWALIKGKHGIEYLPITWKYLLAAGAFIITQWIMVIGGGAIIIGLAAEVVMFLYLYRQIIGRKEIMNGLEKIAEGNVEHKISLEKIKGDQLEIADRINSMSEGLEAALEESLKNERMKTDLITNVSHDIKTPLTSIINYVDLLKREDIQDEKIRGYIEILESKAQRLKILTEDVVEASRASSGNVTLECMNLNLVEMIQQVSGEFEEKFKARKLKEVLTLPQEPAIIWADGRRMWRVLENIYNNAAKYAMEGTRVYGNLEVTEKEVIFSLKNISEQELNISAEELTERFVRGDISRSTEGSGLGLSIAQNLVNLMGGKFELYLDGDLFRVTMTWDRGTVGDGFKMAQVK